MITISFNYILGLFTVVHKASATLDSRGKGSLLLTLVGARVRSVLWILHFVIERLDLVLNWFNLPLNFFQFILGPSSASEFVLMWSNFARCFAFSSLVMERCRSFFLAVTFLRLMSPVPFKIVGWLHFDVVFAIRLTLAICYSRSSQCIPFSPYWTWGVKGVVLGLVQFCLYAVSTFGWYSSKEVCALSF